MFLDRLRRDRRRRTRSDRPRHRSVRFGLPLEGLEERVVLSFAAPTTLPTGTNTAGVVIGNFNGDANPDFAVVNQAAVGTVSVFLRNADGTYQPRVDYSSGAYSSDVVSADFNHDGNADLAVVGTTGTVNLILGNGDGTFGAATSSPVGAGAHSMNVGDFNGDGNADVVTMNTSTASVLLGYGDGTFRPRMDAAIPGSSTDTVVGDFNRDGMLDVATSNTMSLGTITVLRGRGDGSFDPAASYSAYSAPVYLASGDYNHDGYDDFVVANSYAATSMSVILNNGDGTYAPPKTYNIAQTGYEIESADFNGDGDEDFAVRGASSYMVELGKGDGTFYPSVNYSVPAGRFEMGRIGDLNGDGSVDFLFPSSAGVTMMINAADDRANLAGAVGFRLSAPASVTAGSPLTLTVTAVDASGNVATGFVGTVYVSSNDPASPTSIAYTFTAADAGVHVISSAAVLTTPGVQTVTAAAPFLASATTSVVVSPGVARFDVAAPATTTAGNAVLVTVSAVDSLGNIAAGYSSTIHFSAADALAGLPADYTFTPGDAGVHVFAVTLRTAGSRFLSVTETVGGKVSGGATIQVTPGAAQSFALAGGGGAIGVARPVTVVARDAFGNTDPTYAGTIHVTSSDPNAVLPADTTLSGGVGSFSITLLSVGTQSITATDSMSGITGNVLSTATPPTPSKFTLSGFPSSTAGATGSFTLTVTDTIGQTATGYVGTVYFSSSDVQAGLPTSYTFTAADAGVHVFSAVLRTAGAQSIAANDYAGGLSGVQAGINVTPAAFASYRLSVPNPADSKGHVLVTAGDNISLTVRATDAFGNTVAGYRGKAKFSSTDTLASLPTDYSFTTADAGSHVFNVALKTATPNGTVWSFGVVDASNSATLATITNFEVLNAAPVKFTMNAPTNATTGTPFTLRVTVLDAFGNKVKNYFGTVHFSDTAAATGLPADYAFTVDDAGSHDFVVTLSTAADQTISVVDTSNTSLFVSSLIKVKAGSTTTTGGGGGGSGGGGSGGGGSGGGGSGGGGGKKV